MAQALERIHSVKKATKSQIVCHLDSASDKGAMMRPKDLCSIFDLPDSITASQSGAKSFSKRVVIVARLVPFFVLDMDDGCRSSLACHCWRRTRSWNLVRGNSKQIPVMCWSVDVRHFKPKSLLLNAILSSCLFLCSIQNSTEVDLDEHSLLCENRQFLHLPGLQDNQSCYTSSASIRAWFLLLLSSALLFLSPFLCFLSGLSVVEKWSRLSSS